MDGQTDGRTDAREQMSGEEKTDEKIWDGKLRVPLEEKSVFEAGNSPT